MNSNECPSEQTLSRYHDGELTADCREQIAAHLAWCEACRELVAQWSEISNFFQNTPHQKLSAIARARINGHMDEVMDRGILRLAWTMSGLAASVLLVGSIWLMRTEDRAASMVGSAPPWVAVAYASEMGQSQHEPATPAAEWYLASSAGSSDDLP